MKFKEYSHWANPTGQGSLIYGVGKCNRYNHSNGTIDDLLGAKQHHMPDRKSGYFEGHNDNVGEITNEIGYHISFDQWMLRGSVR